MTPAKLCLVFHAHLPFVRHPEHDDFLEEDWLFEAITEAYVPLWSRLVRLADEGVRYGVTLTISPTLAAMLDDVLLRKRLHRYIGRLSRLAETQAQIHGKSLQGDTARQAVARCQDTLRFLARWKDDLLAPLRHLQSLGCVEIAGCNGTHGLLPLMSTAAARRAQIRAGADAHARNFGRRPRGMWLAECGYDHGIDEQLAEADVQFFFVDAAAIERGRPPSPYGLFAPVKTAAGVAAFARDHETGRQVWSSDQGYPGDPAYREFHRDFGHEAKLEDIAPFLPPDGRRRPMGLKYYRVTGRDVPLHEKQLYDPAAALARTKVHAADFVMNRQRQALALAPTMEQPPVITACYDAELFGHWWHEGPAFIEEVLRLVARTPEIETATAANVLDEALTFPQQSLAPSTWGAESSSKVWLNPETTWVYPELHKAEARMQTLVRRFGHEDGLMARALQQIGRELLLAQSSDWTFLITLATAPDYGRARLREHLDAFARLAYALETNTLRDGDLIAREKRTPLFPDLDVTAWG